MTQVPPETRFPVSEAGQSGRKGVQRPVLTYAEFARELQRASRTLWCIAAAIVRDRTEAEDVVQEAAVIGLSKLDQFDPATNFTAWMGSIVRYVALNQSRRTARRNLTLTDPSTLDAAGGRSGTSDSGGSGGDGGRTGDRRGPLNRGNGADIDEKSTSAANVIGSDGRLLPDQAAFDDHVLRALGSLDETPRACLLLRTLLDLPYRDISRALGIPEGTAMSHVHRARSAMRKKLTAGPEEKRKQ